jgi:hypothetical protein
MTIEFPRVPVKEDKPCDTCGTLISQHAQSCDYYFLSAEYDKLMEKRKEITEQLEITQRVAGFCIALTVIMFVIAIVMTIIWIANKC